MLCGEVPFAWLLGRGGEEHGEEDLHDAEQGYPQGWMWNSDCLRAGAVTACCTRALSDTNLYPLEIMKC